MTREEYEKLIAGFARTTAKTDISHGTLSGYKIYQCRCNLCKASNADYERIRHNSKLAELRSGFKK